MMAGGGYPHLFSSRTCVELKKKKKTSFGTRSDHTVRLHIIIYMSHRVRYKLILPGRALQSQFVNNRMAGGVKII